MATIYDVALPLPMLTELDSRGVPPSLPRGLTAGELEMLSRAGEAPDPRYWTAYDIYMIELEARQMRRAAIYAMFARVAKWIRDRVAGNTKLQPASRH
jgi:hypothetical protein